MPSQSADNEKRIQQNNSSSNSNRNMEGKLKYYFVADELQRKSNKVVRFSDKDTICTIYPQDWEGKITSWEREIESNKKNAHKYASRLKRLKEEYASINDQLDEECRRHNETVCKMETLEKKNTALQRLLINLSKERNQTQTPQPHQEKLPTIYTKSIRTRSLDFISKIEKDLLNEVVTRNA
jgi:chromosome segregation ATPase